MKIQQAIQSIADEGDSNNYSAMAQICLDNKDYMSFANYIYDQINEDSIKNMTHDNESTLKNSLGSTVIKTIIEYRKDIILSSNPSAHHLIVINKMLKDCLSKYKR